MGHGDGAVGLPHGQNVVDAVPGHGHPVALSLKSLNQLPLLLRGDPAEHRVFRGGTAQPFLGVHPAHVHPGGGALQPGLGRHGGRRLRVVAGNHFHGYPLPPEVGQGVRCPGPDGIREHQGGQCGHLRERGIRIDGIGGGSDHQHPLAPLDLRAQLLRQHGAGHPLRRAHHQRAQIRELHGAPLPPGGEGDLGRRLQSPAGGGEIAPHGLEGGVVVIAVGQERPHPLRRGDGRIFCQRHHPLHPHVPLGEGAGLVQAQHIRVGQALQREQVLHQHPGFRQLGHTHRQADGDQQHQPLGEHAQQAGGGGGHRVKQRRLPQNIRLQEQEHAQRRDQKAGKAGNLPHGGQQF